jgi:5-methylcytosine-specific restriction protein B
LARLATSGVDEIYAMHSRWLGEVLGPGDSLLSPGTPIWTIEHLEELERLFIGQPDLTKDKRFLEKLRDQLAEASPGAVQLMAEIHVVHFLIIWTGAISAAKKRSDLEAILSWMPAPARVPDDVSEAMGPGVVHPGQWVMTRRDTQLTWLIRFARAWKAQAIERQQALVSDAWQLKTFSEEVVAPASDSARLALLHLAHPDTFEAIVSQGHKDLIAARFDDVAGGERDVDRRLLAIRTELTPRLGAGFNWYNDPLVHLWLKHEKAWKSFLDWLRRLRELPSFDAHERTYKLEVASKVRATRDLVVDGDDGWYDALKASFGDSKNNLTQWQTHDSFLKWADTDRGAAMLALQALWRDDDAPIQRLDEFLERVPAAALGPLGERLNISTFLLMAEDPLSLPPMKISVFRRAWKLTKWERDAEDLRPADVYGRVLVFLDELVRDSSRWDTPLRDRLDAQGAVWALVRSKEKPPAWSSHDWDEFVTWRTSEPSDDDDDDQPIEPPRPGPAVEPPSLVDHIAAAAKKLHLDRAVLDEIVELLDDKRQVVLYGPPGTGKTFVALRLAEAIAEGSPERVSIVQFHPATTYEDFFEGLRPKLTAAGQVTYERTDGPLVAIAKAAAADPDRRYVMVIDEINRANLPKVFGELLFLLEYRNESARTLYRPTEPFQLPANLWFIGTMNTADRSVALIDAAMRRRFHFVPFFPHDGPMKGLLARWLHERGGSLAVAVFLDAVNEELLSLVGEHLLIGPSHFMKTDLSDRALERIWSYNVFPLIEEQLWGNSTEVDRWRWSAVRERFNAAFTAAVAEPNAGAGGGDEVGGQPV